MPIKYICDICGEEIRLSENSPDVLTMTVVGRIHVYHDNGGGKYWEVANYHEKIYYIHVKCFENLTEIFKGEHKCKKWVG